MVFSLWVCVLQGHQTLDLGPALIQLWPHLNLTAFAKTLFPNKVSLTALRVGTSSYVLGDTNHTPSHVNTTWKRQIPGFFSFLDRCLKYFQAKMLLQYAFMFATSVLSFLRRSGDWAEAFAPGRGWQDWSLWLPEKSPDSPASWPGKEAQSQELPEAVMSWAGGADTGDGARWLRNVACTQRRTSGCTIVSLTSVPCKRILFFLESTCHMSLAYSWFGPQLWEVMC